MYEDIIVKKEEGVATIILNRPTALNALSARMSEELDAALTDIESDESINVMVLTGAGRGFCSGGDVRAFAEGRIPNKEWMLKSGRRAARIINFDKPVICAVNGVAAGAGFGLALTGDIVIASEDARFVMAFVKLGLIADYGSSYTLPRLVGLSKAKEICWTGETISAVEAEKLGIVSKVVPADQFEAAVKELANKLARGPAKSIKTSKMLLNRSRYINDLSTVLELEAEAQPRLFATEDFKEGMRAFQEKRAPQFKGR